MPGDESAAELLARAETLLTNAKAQLLEDGDLGAYQDAVEEASDAGHPGAPALEPSTDG